MLESIWLLEPEHNELLCKIRRYEAGGSRADHSEAEKLWAHVRARLMALSWSGMTTFAVFGRLPSCIEMSAIVSHVNDAYQKAVDKLAKNVYPNINIVLTHM